MVLLQEVINVRVLSQYLDIGREDGKSTNSKMLREIVRQTF